MLEEIATLERDAGARLAAASDLDELRRAEAELLGRRSELAGIRQRLGGLEPDERRQVGRALNDAWQRLEGVAATRRRELEAGARRARLEAERLDLTEFRPRRELGHRHLVTRVVERLEDVFVGMGYRIAEGPIAETDWHNFEALNFPPYHPARDMYDTFYLDVPGGDILLRTHTSPVQVRVMTSQPPPIYVAVPGVCARSDTADASHLPVFSQIEGLAVDRGITMRHLAGTLDAFVGALLGEGISTRLRPSYFPFTEPSAEFDITCVFCAGKGCRTCERTGFVELGGCGMVHPNVFRACGVDPEEWTGFAFGFGIERLALFAYEVDDMREFVTNDVRFLEQF